MARSATIRIEAQTADAREEVAQLEGDLQGVEVAAVDAGDGFERLSSNASQELSETRSEARQTAASMDQMSSSARGSANSLGIELTQAAQDASFGVAGVANQLPQLQMEFQRLQSQTGSTRGALTALGSAFAGPTGVLAAGTLLLQFMPQIMSAFEDMGDTVGDTTEEVEGLSEATSSVVDVTSTDLRELELSLDDVGTAIEQTDQRIGTLESRIGGLSELREDVGRARAGRVISQLERVQELEAQGRIDDLTEAGRPGELLRALRQSTLTVQDLREALQQGETELISLIERRVEASRKELVTEKGVRDDLTKQRKELEQRLRAQGRLVELGAERAETESENTEETKEQQQAMNGLAVSAKQAAENMVTVRRTLNSMDQMPMQRRISAFGAGFQAPTVGGTMLNQGQSQGGLMLEAAQDAGFVEGFMDFSDVFRGGGGGGQTGQPEGLEAVSMSLEEIQQEFGVSEDKARQFKRTANQQLGSVINAAGQLGQSLVRAFSKGERSAKSIAASLLQGVGGVLSVIPGVGQIAGPVLGQLGGLIGAFDEGGVVNTPLQVVGESGPELAALPQGTRVSTARETERMLAGAQSVNVNIETELQRLPNGDLGVAVRESQRRKARHE